MTAKVARLCGALLAAGLCLASPLPAAAEEPGTEGGWWQWAQFDEWCDGDCYVTGYAGQFLDSNMTGIFMIDDTLVPWEYQFREDYMVAGSVSRRVATLFNALDLELEAGAGLRFGDEEAGEVWIAAYARWTWFPWDDWVDTTFGISTGFNYATVMTDFEQDRADTRSKVKILHYLSPEFTFADPDWETTEVVLRLHHRSGGALLWGDSRWFKDASGGAQYLLLGLRHRF